MTPSDTAESGFMIDGKHYPVPALDTFTMGDAVTLYEYSGLTLEDFAAPDPDVEDAEAEQAKKIRHPGLMQTLLHIAYERGNPGVKKAKVKLMVESVNLLEALQSLVEDEEDDDDADPPPQGARTSDPAGSSLNESSGSASETGSPNGSSGSDSETDSVAPADARPTIGTTRSATLHTYVPETSAA